MPGWQHYQIYGKNKGVRKEKMTCEMQYFSKYLRAWDAFRESQDEHKSASEKNTSLARRGAVCLKVLCGILN